MCLSRRNAVRTRRRGDGPIARTTAEPIASAGGRYSSWTVTSVLRSSGARSKRTAPRCERRRSYVVRQLIERPGSSPVNVDSHSNARPCDLPKRQRAWRGGIASTARSGGAIRRRLPRSRHKEYRISGGLSMAIASSTTSVSVGTLATGSAGDRSPSGIDSRLASYSSQPPIPTLAAPIRPRRCNPDLKNNNPAAAQNAGDMASRPKKLCSRTVHKQSVCPGVSRRGAPSTPKTRRSGSGSAGSRGVFRDRHDLGTSCMRRKRCRRLRDLRNRDAEGIAERVHQGGGGSHGARFADALGPLWTETGPRLEDMNLESLKGVERGGNQVLQEALGLHHSVRQVDRKS